MSLLSEPYVLVVATADSPHIYSAATLLHTQWPRGGSIQEYLDKIIIQSNDNNNNTLPCSYILIDRASDTFLGHVRITECVDDSSGKAVAATYVIVPTQRKGHGRALMMLLEEKVIELGYHYIYVWTHTAVDFYKKCGYVETHKISLHRPCLKRLETNQVSQLEAILSSRMNQKRTNTETVLLPPGTESEHNDEDVWLRKRLVEYLSIQTIDSKTRLGELEQAAQLYPDSNEWRYCVMDVPWTRQVGPSCGLAALRMISAYYGTINRNESDATTSLLEYAVEQGFSQDGEVFDATHLCQIARNCCELHCQVMSFDDMTKSELLVHLLRRQPVMLAYDSQPFSRLPCKNRGQNAHYGIVVGMMLGSSRAADTGQSLQCINDSDDNDECHVSTIAALGMHRHCLLLVQHSLSEKLSIASWDDFYQSNQQLLEADKQKFKDAHSLNLKDYLIVFSNHDVDDDAIR